MSDSNNKNTTPHRACSTSTSKPQSALKDESTSKLQHLLKLYNPTMCESGSRLSSASKPHSASKSESSTPSQSTSKLPSVLKSGASKPNPTIVVPNSRVSASGIKPLDSNDELNFTTSCVSTIKRSIHTKPIVNQDRDLEVKLTYNEYLQAKFKKMLLEETLTRQRQDFKDQIFLQGEKNYKCKVELIKTKQKLNKLELLEKIEIILQQLLTSQKKFDKISQNTNLEFLLSKLVTILRKISSRVYTDKVSFVTTEESYEQLTTLMFKSALTSKASTPSNFDEVNNLAVLIKSLQKSVVNFIKTQNMFNATHKAQTSKLLKALSDFYASRENSNSTTNKKD